MSDEDNTTTATDPWRVRKKYFRKVGYAWAKKAKTGKRKGQIEINCVFSLKVRKQLIKLVKNPGKTKPNDPDYIVFHKRI